MAAGIPRMIDIRVLPSQGVQDRKVHHWFETRTSTTIAIDWCGERPNSQAAKSGSMSRACKTMAIYNRWIGFLVCLFSGNPISGQKKLRNRPRAIFRHWRKYTLFTLNDQWRGAEAIPGDGNHRRYSYGDNGAFPGIFSLTLFFKTILLISMWLAPPIGATDWWPISIPSWCWIWLKTLKQGRAGETMCRLKLISATFWLVRRLPGFPSGSINKKRVCGGGYRSPTNASGVINVRQMKFVQECLRFP